MTVAEWTEPLAEVGLAAWAHEAAAAAKLAAGLAGTPFVPHSLRVWERSDVLNEQATAAMVAAALLTGRELGLSPMAALRSVDVVNGTPALRALALRGLVLARGHTMWLVESTKTRAIMRGQRAGDSHVQESVWTMDRARDLGITGRDQWRRQPQNMLVARATAELARLIAPDAVLGLPYVVEELDDSGAAASPQSQTPDTEAAPAPSKRTARRRPLVRPVVDAQLPPAPEDTLPPEPDLDDVPPPPDEQPEPEPAPISQAQMDAMHAGFRAIGVSDREARLSLVQSTIGRDIATSGDLTYAEAGQVLDMLRAANEAMEP